MTRPVEELYFPSVVACPGRDTPVDTMAPIARLLMPVRFQCKTTKRLIKAKNERDCDEKTDQVRKDFDFLFQFAIDNMEKLIKDMFEESNVMKRMSPEVQKQVHEVATNIQLLLDTKSVSHGQIRERIKSQFSMTNSTLLLCNLNKELNISFQLSAEHKRPSMDALELSFFFIASLNNLGNFGYFIAELLPEQMPRYFATRITGIKKHKPTNCNYMGTYTKFESYSAINDLLSKLTKAMHELASPNKTVGTRVWPSIYELVNLVSYQPTQSLFKPSLATWFPYSACGFFNESNWDSMRRITHCVEKHEDHIYGRIEEDPCLRDGSVCCSLDAAFELTDLRAIMSIVRLAKHRGQVHS